MDNQLPSALQLSPEVARALSQNFPLVALESTVITHGLPYPDNINLAEDMENEVRRGGAVPATIAVIDGIIHVGLIMAQMQRLVQPSQKLYKVSIRDFSTVIASGESGGTTVAATMLAAHLAGIRVFATGGIGGVHHSLNPRQRFNFDISADLPALATIPMVVVCAGAKAILDLPATLEYLETWGVPVVGYRTDDFPAFYAQSSGLKTGAKADSPQEVAAIAQAHWSLGMKSAILVAVPPPDDVAMPVEEVNLAISQALREARLDNVRGQDVTPFLLERVRRLTRGDSLRANLGLLLNNASVATQIARVLAPGGAGFIPG